MSSKKINAQKTAPVLIVLLTLTFVAHAILGVSGYDMHIDRRKAAGFTWQILSNHPGIVWQLARELAAPALLIWLFFGFLLLLARGAQQLKPARNDARFALFLNWIAACWLLARLHTFSFPRSVWTVAVEPLTARAAAPGLDLVAALWLIATLIATGFSLIRPQNNAFRQLRCTLLLPAAVLLLLGAYGGLQVGIQRDSALKETTLNTSTEDQQPPNILVIGLDSLRRDIALDTTGQLTPHLAKFSQHAYIETNVISPLARTFPAWTTILTGQHPAENSVRDNLAPQNTIPTHESLAWKLKQHGYRTVYATDETRFSNIGHAFGFDQVIAPRAGVSDYLLGQFGDQPLINFMVQWPLSEYWLPSLVGNRAFAQAYRPQRFNERVSLELGSATAQPTFIATHFCTAHWPYYDADTELGSNPQEHPYFRSVRALDQQFQDYLDLLRHRGYLTEKTLLVVLADHGESLHATENKPSTITLHPGAAEMTGVPSAGHGNSLLSPSQWQVFVMFSGQGATGSIPAGRSGHLASLEDVSSAVTQLAGFGGAKQYGMHLPKLMLSTPAEVNQTRPYVRIETGFRPRGFDPTKPDGEKALRIAMDSFNVQADGRVEMKQEAILEAIKSKDYGITDGDNLLSAMANDDGDRLVSMSIGERTWDVYPLNQPPKIIPALFALACAEQHMRPLLSEACREK